MAKVDARETSVKSYRIKGLRFRGVRKLLQVTVAVQFVLADEVTHARAWRA